MGLLINDYEYLLFDEITREHLNLTGEDTRYWVANVVKNVYDNVYGEPMPSKYTYDGGYLLKAVIKYNPPDASIDIGGVVYTLDCEVYYSRFDFDKIGIIPKVGDIVQIFKNSRWHPADVKYDITDGIFYNVIQTGDYGHIHNTNKYTWYKLTLNRRTDIVPDMFIRSDRR
jgi:hypothetical protein